MYYLFTRLIETKSTKERQIVLYEIRKSSLIEEPELKKTLWVLIGLFYLFVTWSALALLPYLILPLTHFLMFVMHNNFYLDISFNNKKILNFVKVSYCRGLIKKCDC